MKTLIVYYSLEGNTDYMAKRIADATGADTLRLVPKKAYRDKGFLKILLGGKSAIMGEKPELEPYDPELDMYDKVIIGFPVWASTITPPVRTFADENRDELKEKSVSAFCCEAGSGGDKALEELSRFIGKDLDYTAIFIDPKKHPSDENEEALTEFLKELNGEEQGEE